MTENQTEPLPVIDVVPDEVLINRAVVVAAIVDAVMNQKKDLAKELDLRLRKGAKETATNPADGEMKLGTVSKSFPDAKAEVTDHSALDDYLRDTRPLDLDVQVALGPIEEVAPILMEHAPHLVTQVTVVPQWMRDNALREALAPGRVIPGVGVTHPAGTLTIRPNAHAKKMAADVLASSPVQLTALPGVKS